MRLPTFSRQSATDTTQDDRAAVAGASTVARPDDQTTTRFTTAGAAADRRATEARAAQVRAERDDAQSNRAGGDDHTDSSTARGAVAARDRQDTETTREQPRVPEATGPKPRASLLATLGLILGVAGALLVLSGPLLGYGIGVAVLALVLSLAGIRATGRRHVAGKTDALIGMVLALAAIVVGVLALTGSLSWLGTDMQPVDSARNWLDAQFVNRF